MSGTYMIIIFEIAGIALLIGFNVFLTVRRKAFLNRNDIESMQKMEDELDRQLEHPERKAEGGSRLRPYEERYHSGDKKTVEKKGLRIELRVRTPLSEKKYLNIITDILKIGSGPDEDLVLDSQEVSKHEAVLKYEKNILYFQKMNRRSIVYVQRNHSRQVLKEEPFQVQSQDQFYIHDVVLEIRFV